MRARNAARSGSAEISAAVESCIDMETGRCQDAPNAEPPPAHVRTNLFGGGAPLLSGTSWKASREATMNDPRHPIRFSPAKLDVDDERTDAGDPELTREELAWELVEVLDELTAEELSELVTKNVPREAHDFFTHYAREFCEGLPIDKTIRARLPNLMLLGYLLRVLEERLLTPGESDESFDA